MAYSRISFQTCYKQMFAKMYNPVYILRKINCKNCYSTMERSYFLQLESTLCVSHHQRLQQVCWICKKTHKFPELLESDLEERFVRGSGPGGQNVNKTANNVVLKHLPTGIVVKCHETRIQGKNRKIAREKLIEQLDVFYNGEDSFRSLQKSENSRNRQLSKQKNRKRLDMKKTFKEREGLD